MTKSWNLFDNEIVVGEKHLAKPVLVKTTIGDELGIIQPAIWELYTAIDSQRRNVDICCEYDTVRTLFSTHP